MVVEQSVPKTLVPKTLITNILKNPGTDRTIPLLCSTDMGGHFGPKITCEISHGPYTTPVRSWSTHYR
jgi:hypothetical protein